MTTHFIEEGGGHISSINQNIVKKIYEKTFKNKWILVMALSAKKNVIFSVWGSKSQFCPKNPKWEAPLTAQLSFYPNVY